MKQKNRVYENGLTFLKLRVPSVLTDGEPGYFYIEDITLWREDMNFMFEWQE